MVNVEALKSYCYFVTEHSDCWLWDGTLTHLGYAAPSLGRCRADNRKLREATGLQPVMPVHQQLARQHDGWRCGLEGRHTCGVYQCVNHSHIVPGTKHKNMQDCVLHRTHNKVVLFPDEAMSIYSDKRDRKVIAAQYGIRPENVKQIQNGHSWRWLTHA